MTAVHPALRRIPVLVLAAACAGAVCKPGPVPPLASEPFYVELAIDSLTCDVHTDESGSGALRDEVYVRVAGQTPAGHVAQRLPFSASGDGYYQFFQPQVSTRATPTSWTDERERVVPYPRLWAGSLAPGATADFVVFLGEQDNKSLDDVIEPLRVALARIEGLVPDPIVRAAVAAALPLLGAIPTRESDDVLGAFTVRLENRAGTLAATWIAARDVAPGSPEASSTTIENTSDPYVATLEAQGVAAASFRLDGTGGGRYRAVVTARRLPGPQPLDHVLEKTTDACREPAFAVHGASGAVTVARGASAEVPVAAPRFSWSCGGDRGWTTCADGTNHVTVTRDTGGRIDWTCKHRS
jgi:hypothetical protein